jgi:hypothetical protein
VHWRNVRRLLAEKLVVAEFAVLLSIAPERHREALLLAFAHVDIKGARGSLPSLESDVRKYRNV